MTGQRQDCSTESGIKVAVLFPAVADKDVVSDPTHRRRWLNRESEPDFVARVQDNVPVIYLVQQLLDIAEPSVETFQVEPGMTRRHDVIVIRSLRRRRSGR